MQIIGLLLSWFNYFSSVGDVVQLAIPSSTSTSYFSPILILVFKNMIILGLAAYIWRNRVAGLVSTNIDFSYKRSSVTRLKNCKEIVFLGVRGGGEGSCLPWGNC